MSGPSLKCSQANVSIVGGASNGNHRLISGSTSQYVKLNVGGSLFYTTIATLTKHDSMLRAMFSGRLEVLTDEEGWVLIDRCGKHFSAILNYLRDGTIAMPEARVEILEILAEAKYYCIQGLCDLCNSTLDAMQQSLEDVSINRIPIITSPKEENKLISQTAKPVIKLLLNRHNNKYSYTSQSDDNLLKNLELFEKLVVRFCGRVLFIKDVGAANEVCSWTFYGRGNKIAEVCCTSIVYATDKKHTKVEFPEARIYEEAMNVLLFEPPHTCVAGCACRKEPQLSGVIGGPGSVMDSLERWDLIVAGNQDPPSPCHAQAPHALGQALQPCALSGAAAAVVDRDSDSASAAARQPIEKLEKARRGLRGV